MPRVETQRIDSATLRHTFSRIAVDGVRIRVRPDEKLAAGIVRGLFTPALSDRIAAEIHRSIQLETPSPLGADRALTNGALEPTIQNALGTVVATHASDFEHALVGNVSDGGRKRLALTVTMHQLKAAIYHIRSLLDLAEQRHIVDRDAAESRVCRNRKPAADVFFLQRRRAIAPDARALDEIRAHRPTATLKNRSLLKLPLSPQTKAVLHIELACLGRADTLPSLRTAAELAVDPRTKAVAEYQLARRNDGDVVERFRRVAELAIEPQLRACAEYELAKRHDGNVLERYQRVAHDATDPDMREAAELELALLNDGDVLGRLLRLCHARASQVRASAQYLLALRNVGNRADRFRLVTELATKADLRAAAEYQLALMKDGDVDERLRRASELASSPTLRTEIEAVLRLRQAELGDDGSRRVRPRLA